MVDVAVSLSVKRSNGLEHLAKFDSVSTLKSY